MAIANCPMLRSGANCIMATALLSQEVTNDMNRYTIKMGNHRSPSCLPPTDGSTWMHGPEEVKFRDRGDWGVFKWDDFRLEVHED